VAHARPYPACLAAGVLALAGALAPAVGAEPPAAPVRAHAAHHPLTIREAKRQILDNIESEWHVDERRVSLRCRQRGRYRVRCDTSFTTSGGDAFCGVSTARAYGPQRHRVMTNVRVRLCG